MPNAPGMLDLGFLSSGSDFPTILNAYVQKVSTMDQLEVIGIIAVLLAVTQITLCLSMIMENYAISRRYDIR